MDLPQSPPDLPSPPFHTVSGIANLRDIGGYPLNTPINPRTHSVRRGLLYRSADPSRVTPAGLTTLASDLGVRKIFDLRSLPELQRVGAEWAGVSGPTSTPFYTHDDVAQGTVGDRAIERVWTPVFADADYSPEKIAVRYKAYTTGAAGFVSAYKDILAYAGRAYGAILRYLAREDAEPALIHCTAGKDRTGVLVAVLYLLLGVEEGRIAEEYSLTDEGLRLMKPMFRERLLQNEALKGNVEGVDNMTASRRENMEGTVKMIRETYGSAEGYLREVVGLTDGEIEGLRRRFASDEEPVL